MSWLTAFVWTFALEQPVYLWALRRRSVRWWEPPLCALALNLLTHPALWLWASRERPAPAGLAAAEALVALVEGAGLAFLLARRGEPPVVAALAGPAWALAANLLSWRAGGWLFATVLG